MGDQRQFTLKQIVWAKVPNYPWWPAKIVKTLAQSTRKIYRVHFFGDPTYCYLQSQQLLDFQYGLSSVQEGNSMDIILKKSIELAKGAYKKSKLQLSDTNPQYQYSAQIQPIMTDSYQQTKLESKVVIENMEKQSVDEKNKIEIEIRKTEVVNYLEQISTQNVIQHINGSYLRSMKAGKGYNNRKEVIHIQNHLKQILLSKYNLSNVSNQFPGANHKKPPKRIYTKKLNNYQKVKKPKIVSSFDVQRLSARNLCMILGKYLQLSASETQQCALRVIEELRIACLNNNKKYASIYLKTVKAIKWLGYQNSQQPFDRIKQTAINCSTLDSIKQILVGFANEKKKLDFSRMCTMDEQPRRQDEEKSKVTQFGNSSL